MTEIKPLQAVLYNRAKVADLAQVVCPPYDVISSARQKQLHDKDPFNFLHVLLAKDPPGGQDKYRIAGDLFRRWLKEKVFVQDAAPAFYFYRQEFLLGGEKRQRVGFIGLLRLEEKGTAVYAHEHTRREAKEDRFKLMSQVKADLDPIFVVVNDRARIIRRTYLRQVRDAVPFIDIVDDEKVGHRLWRVDDPETVKRIEAAMAPENFFIADGHHRYEVACAYRDEMRRQLGTLSGQEPFQYVLAYFTNPDPRGLIILPIHRQVQLDRASDTDEVRSRLKAHFDVEEVKDKVRFFFLLQKAGSHEHILGMYKDKKYWLLRLKNVKILDKVITGKPPEYRSLDVAVLNALVLEGALGLAPGDAERLSYHPDPEEVISGVDRDPARIGFFLNPVKMTQIMSVALAGEKMPPKSTYFYPKVLAGLVVNKF